MNLSMKQKQTHRHREQTNGCRAGGVRGSKDWEFAISSYKLSHIGWINNKILLYFRELFSISWDKPQWERIYRRCMCVYK